MIHTLTVKSARREEIIDITALVRNVVQEAKCEKGFVYLFVPHTTAGLTINENADPDVKRDLLYKLKKEIPIDDDYHHAEGNSDAHLKASLFGFSLQLLIEKSQIVLGTWQGIQFCEFDGPRSRRLIVKVVPVAQN